MRILITGAAGNLGRELTRQLLPAHDVVGADLLGDVAHRLDICDYAACIRLIDAAAPDLVIHAAAWTDVDGCALDPPRATRVNGIGAQNIAVGCARHGIPIVYISTNEVFDGRRRLPYREYDLTNPINAYGGSKCYGERAIAAVNPRHYIVRTSWLFASGGGNFIHAILRAAEAGKQLRVVINEVANPTYTVDLAAAIAELIGSGRYGTYHLVNRGAASRWQLARYALDAAGMADLPIERIALAQWQRASTPPEYAALDNIAAASLGIELRHWQDAVDAFLAARTSSA